MAGPRQPFVYGDMVTCGRLLAPHPPRVMQARPEAAGTTYRGPLAQLLW
jgi:hypothetical protein